MIHALSKCKGKLLSWELGGREGAREREREREKRQDTCGTLSTLNPSIESLSMQFT
jgi:hypothetical protein